MVIALLVCLAATVGTGLVAYGDRGKGPLAESNGTVIKTAHADEISRPSTLQAGDSGAESVVGELHNTLANLTLGLVVLHVLGVGLASVRHRENLVAAMITGWKRTSE